MHNALPVEGKNTEIPPSPHPAHTSVPAPSRNRINQGVHLRRWQAAGNDVAGLQLDFDAATRGFEGYAKFLQQVRQRLPREWRLSITGLMDWSAHGDPRALTKLARTVDEVVVQTYQGRSTIPGYEDYFRRMKDFPIPFRVALVEGGSWREPPQLAQHPQFRGYVVFLLNPAEPRH